MKLITLIIGGFLLLAPPTRTPLVYTEVVAVEGATKDALYNRALVFFTSTFNGATGTINIQDKETGTLAANGRYLSRYLKNMYGVDLKDYPCYTTFKLTVAVKDGRYKYDFTDYYETCSSSNDKGVGVLTTSEVYDGEETKKKYWEKVWVESKSSADAVTKALIVKMNEAMNVPDPSKQDW